MNLECLNCVDLFSGAGGFSLAAKQAGYRIRLAVEKNPRAVLTYKANLCTDQQSPLVLDTDITKLLPDEIRDRIFQKGEKCDLLLGGPPCQGFSSHRIKGAGVGDPRNNLILTYFEFVASFRPSIFLMENVPGMLWPRHTDYLEAFYETARSTGYEVMAPAIIDAADFGVPQRRKRVFILGVRHDIAVPTIWPPLPTHGNDDDRRLNPALKPWRSCNEVFEKAPENDSNDIHMRHGPELITAFANTPHNGGSRKDSGRVLPCHFNHDGHKDVYGRINSKEVAPTMTTACINPSKGRFVHPTENHGITVRQAARIQTFPDTFIFQGGLISAGEQIGNAVPVHLGRYLIDHITPTILGARNDIASHGSIVLSN